MADEYRLRLQLSRVENGDFMAQSEDLPGLVAQGRTLAETVEIAQDVACKLIESCREHGDPIPEGLEAIHDQSIELDVAVGA